MPYRATADEHNQKALNRTSGSYNPSKTDEQDHTEDVLDAG